MQLYAETPRRRMQQIVMDVAALAWIAWWFALGHRIWKKFADAGNTTGSSIEGAGKDVTQSVTDTANTISGIPMVGDKVADSLRKLTGIGNSLETVGGDVRDQLSQMGLLMAAIVTAIPIGVMLVFWLQGRLRYALHTTRGVPKVRTSPDALERLALMAIVHRDASKVAAVAPHAIRSWREGDEDVIRALAELELNERGLVMPGDSRARRIAEVAHDRAAEPLPTGGRERAEMPGRGASERTDEVISRRAAAAEPLREPAVMPRATAADGPAPEPDDVAENLPLDPPAPVPAVHDDVELTSDLGRRPVPVSADEDLPLTAEAPGDDAALLDDPLGDGHLYGEATPAQELDPDHPFAEDDAPEAHLSDDERFTDEPEDRRGRR